MFYFIQFFLIFAYFSFEYKRWGSNSHLLHGNSRQDERVRLLINNVIIGGLPEASQDQDGAMADVFNYA